MNIVHVAIRKAKSLGTKDANQETFGISGNYHRYYDYDTSVGKRDFLDLNQQHDGYIGWFEYRSGSVRFQDTIDSFSIVTNARPVELIFSNQSNSFSKDITK